nr:RpiB/LacA/LacB family sugar-phosphate isomerase [Corynebacterium sp. UBA5992]
MERRPRRRPSRPARQLARRILVVTEGTRTEPQYAEGLNKYLRSKGATACVNGEQIAANKVKGARCALAWSEETAKLAREHNNAQLIGIGGRMHTEEEALAIVDAFVSQPWSDEERHQRRIDILAEYERTGVAPQP